MKNLPPFEDLPVHTLAGIFNNTTNSYKIYWFYSILQIIKSENKAVITFDEIFAKMIASAWYPTNYFKVSLGKQDKIGRAIEEIKNIANLKDDDKPEIVYATILEHLRNSKGIRSIISYFERYVPYRLLSPFFKNELKGKIDGNKKNLIIDIANKSFLENSPVVFYCFPDKNTIELHPTWFRYFKHNIAIVEGFCLWNMVNFLQKRNPNIPNIGEKLFWVPEKRDLKKARKFWNIVFDSKSVNCIYSGQSINQTNYSIDHFIPWSFVTHDLLWNLVPIQKSINSAKSNNLPALNTYFEDFAKIQFEAYHLIYPKQKGLLEDYVFLFDEEIDKIASLSNSEFSKKLYNQIAPLTQIAANSGFSSNWILNA